MQEVKTISIKKIIAVIIGAIALILLCMIGKLGEDVNNEQIVVNQFPFTGKMEYWTTPGFKWQGFGKTTTYFKTQQLWFNEESGENATIPVIFNDASNGKIYGSLRVKLPTDPKYLARIQTDYNGMDRLMNDLVRPTVVKVVYASGPLMSAFESYAEKKNDLIEYITDQLNNGVYKTMVAEQVTIDPLTDEEKLVKVASLVKDSTAPGGYRRSESSPFAYYGLEIGQVAVSKIDYEDKVNKQIEQQQQANMLVQTSKAKSIAARQESIRAEEEGKAVAMKAKWEQEKEKAIAVTKAQQEFEVAAFEAKKAAEVAQKIKAEGEAEAFRQRKLVEAGLSPKEKAEFDMKTKIGVAEHLSKIKLPTYVVAGGGNGQTNAMDAMGLKMMSDLVKQMSE